MIASWRLATACTKVAERKVVAEWKMRDDIENVSGMLSES